MFSDSHPHWSALQILPDGAGIWSQPFLVVVRFTVIAKQFVVLVTTVSGFQRVLSENATTFSHLRG